MNYEKLTVFCMQDTQCLYRAGWLLLLMFREDGDDGGMLWGIFNIKN